MTVTPDAPPRAFHKQRIAGMPVTEWPGSGPVVFGLSGLGSHAPTWAPIADSLPDAHFYAIDLRGRGDAQDMPGPTGLRAHATDVAAVLAELDLTDVVLAGHSMGAFLALLVAQEATGRIRKLVLVDGGIRPKLPFFMGPALTKLVFNRQLAAADRPWPTLEELAEKGPMSDMLDQRPDLKPKVMAILRAEVGGEPGAYRPRVDVERASADAADSFHSGDSAAALDALTVPAQVFLAEHRARADQKPFITDKAAARWTARQPLLTVRRLPGNHLTVLFAPEVAEAIGT